MSAKELRAGIYDSLVTKELAEQIDHLSTSLSPSFSPPDLAESHLYFARQAANALRELLRRVEEEGSDKLRLQAQAYNDTLLALKDTEALAGLVSEPVLLLTEITNTETKQKPLTRPIIPLSTSALLVNDDELLNAATVLKREIASADQVDLICAFVNYTGVRILEEEIRGVCQRGRMRLITTTYMGATQRRALDKLSEWGAEIKVTFERPPANTKLHAKAWLFGRYSGFDTAMVGSSNLSHSALMDGLEWNVRLSRAETPQILDRFRSTFDRYWEDAAFEKYDPTADGDRLEKALQESGSRTNGEVPDFFFDVAARPHQTDILEALAADRDRGYNKNLVIAATGTGKTVVAALDYHRMARSGKLPTLLFVAHRAEILRQSATVFRNVLRDGSFGELWFSGERPNEGRQVFASIQSLHDSALSKLAPDQFDVVIVDEFHHAEAATYRRLLTHLSPQILIGLTATPERGDGVNVMQFFGNRATYEMRLWDALEDQLLCPFQYFGIADTVDLSNLSWSSGKYAAQELEAAYLERIVDGAAYVIKHINQIVTDWRIMKALGFCVSIRHAEAMAHHFSELGIPSIALTSRSTGDERKSAIQKLKHGDLNVIFTVDLFNEGIDIPEVDTLLFLRPTESATVFMQQLGRGLRLSKGKPCTAVLDFVGQQHRKFRFDQRFRAITGLSRKALEGQVENGFVTLPSGCHIQLDRVTRDSVLRNIRAALPTKTHELVAEYRSLSGGRADYPLATFVRESGIALEDLYRTNRTYSSIKRAAGVPIGEWGEMEERLSRGLMRMLHSVDDLRLRKVVAILENHQVPNVTYLDTELHRIMYMVAYALSSDFTFGGLQSALDRLWTTSTLRFELKEVLELLAESAPPGAISLRESQLGDVPLSTHGVYSQDEVMTAFGMSNPSAMRQGVKYFPEHRCDVLFVTLRKTDTDYSPTTRYNDYPISPSRFHWESQNSTGSETIVGQRYIHHEQQGSSILLFVRESRTINGQTSPYFCCGPVNYMTHQSNRPMQIIWELKTPLPHRIFQQFRAFAG